METKSLSPVITQIVERKLGMYASSSLGNDTYFLIEAINNLISAIGKRDVQKEIEKKGKKWDEMEKKINLITQLSTQTKIFYDALQDKKFIKKDIEVVESMIRNHFFKSASKIAVLQRDIYDLFIMLVNMTSIKNKTITSDAFKILEHSGTKQFDLTKRPGMNREMIPRE